MDVQTTICQCATGTCNHQQRPLLTFSDLPPELRQQIFSLAIISPPLIRVDVCNLIADPELEAISFKFLELWRGSRDISVLLFCKEFNAVYKKICCAYLPARRRSLIRFDPTATTIFITNFLCNFIKDPDLAYGIKQGWRKQQWVRETRKIGAPNSCFEFMSVYYNPGGVGLNVKGLGQLFEIFENLEEFVCFHDHVRCYPQLARHGSIYMGPVHFDVFAAGLSPSVRELFVEYRDKYNPSFKIPKINEKIHPS
jgi:hypothetical protein